MINKELNIIEEMSTFGINVPSKKVEINIPNANEWFWFTLDKLLDSWGVKSVHCTQYEPIIQWLNGNKGKGLVLMGGVGLGKTIISRFVIPYIFNKCIGKSVAFYSMAQIRTLQDVKGVLENKIIVLDDLGVEEVVNEYGNKIDVFSLIIDEVEKENKLLIATTNLNRELLLKRYKDRAYDRLMSNCKVVGIEAQSLR